MRRGDRRAGRGRREMLGTGKQNPRNIERLVREPGSQEAHPRRHAVLGQGSWPQVVRTGSFCSSILNISNNSKNNKLNYFKKIIKNTN